VRAGASVSRDRDRRAYVLVELDVGALAARLGLLGFVAEPPAEATPAPGPRALPEPLLPAPGARFEPRTSLPISPQAPRHVRLTPQLVREALSAVRRAHPTAGTEQRLASMATRSRLAAGLPDVRLRAGTSQDESLRLAPTLTDPARFTQTGQTDLWVEAQLTWRLARAAFHQDEIRIEQLREGARRQRAELEQRVLDTLIEWQKHVARAHSPFQTSEDGQAAELAALGMQLQLDRLTGGWFSRHLRRSP
jgi:hypothetical protein